VNIGLYTELAKTVQPQLGLKLDNAKLTTITMAGSISFTGTYNKKQEPDQIDLQGTKSHFSRMC